MHRQNVSLFNHLVGGGEQRRWDGEAESLRGFEVDYQLELGWLRDRKIAGYLTRKIRSTYGAARRNKSAGLTP